MSPGRAAHGSPAEDGRPERRALGRDRAPPPAPETGDRSARARPPPGSPGHPVGGTDRRPVAGGSPHLPSLGNHPQSVHPLAQKPPLAPHPPRPPSPPRAERLNLTCQRAPCSLRQV